MNDTSNVPQLNSHTQSSAATATGAPGAPFPEAPARAPRGPLDSFRMSPEGRRRVKGIQDTEVTDCGVIITCAAETRRTEHGYTQDGVTGARDIGDLAKMCWDVVMAFLAIGHLLDEDSSFRQCVHHKTALELVL